MKDILTSINDILSVMGILFPGLVIVSIRSMFLTGRTPARFVILYSMAASVFYFVAFFMLMNIYIWLRDKSIEPVLDIELLVKKPGFDDIWSLLMMFVVVPVSVGVGLGMAAQKGWFRRGLQRIHLDVVHPAPTAWDWKFGAMKDELIRVTLQDGTRIKGFYSSGSFTSSDPAERDIYIQRIINIDGKNDLPRGDDRGILVAAGQIRTIEFYPCTTQESSDE